jgi:2-polyprenyl-3-methyl-5-hydroxy-6-metoxy-1,4-benzoquinol methylase
VSTAANHRAVTDRVTSDRTTSDPTTSDRTTTLPRNPHFDDHRVVWSDAYAGQYAPVAYDQQFDDQWRLFLSRQTGFCDHTGVETSDEYIDDRIAELTGVRDVLWRRRWGALAPIAGRLSGRTARAERRGVGGRLWLEPKFPLDFFTGKRCLDAGCGAGRWTKTMKSLGAHVKSIDVSRHGLASTRRFNDDVEKCSLFDIPAHPALHRAFDFTLCWGVVMCTHDPRAAFDAVASTVRPGGSLYLMVYAPTYHSSAQVLEWRARYHRECRTFEEKLAFAYSVADSPENAINLLDMLNTFYNWVIPEDVCVEWFRANGFRDITLLNRAEPNACGLHVVGTRA